MLQGAHMGTVKTNLQLLIINYKINTVGIIVNWVIRRS